MRNVLLSLALAIGSAAAYGQVNVNGATVDASQGFTYSHAAPNGHVLCGNGTRYVDAATCGTVANPFYQFVKTNGTPVTQRFNTNFTSRFTLSDDGTNTIVDYANVGTPGTCANPTSITTNQWGLVTAYSCGGTATTRTCNGNGCYTIAADGTITAWGQSAATSSGGSAQRLAITFPVSFTTTTGLSLTVSPTGEPNGDGNPHPQDCHVSSGPSTAGATATIALPTQVSGSGYSSFTSGETCTWIAIGQ